MLHPSDTDLRAYSGRALLGAAALSATLHVVLALAVPEWGSGRGLPLLRRPPLIVRMEMVRAGERAGGKDQGSEIRGQERQKEGSGVRGQGSGNAEMASVPSRSPIPDIRYLTPETPVGFSQPSISADGGEKDLRLAARGGEGGSAGGSAGDLPFSPSPALPIGDEELGRGEALEMWQVEDPPKQVRSVDPEYPPMARRMGVEGSVVIRYLVGQDGRVEQMKVLEGPELLREASLHAVGQFVYEPVSDRGRRRKVWMRQVITFRLE